MDRLTKLRERFRKIPKGWWNVDDEWWLTFDALKTELVLSEKQLKNKIETAKPETRTLENPHSHKQITAYKAEDLGIDRDPKEDIWI
jgi:hypothetical protein